MIWETITKYISEIWKYHYQSDSQLLRIIIDEALIINYINDSVYFESYIAKCNTLISHFFNPGFL